MCTWIGACVCWGPQYRPGDLNHHTVKQFREELRERYWKKFETFICFEYLKCRWRHSTTYSFFDSGCIPPMQLGNKICQGDHNVTF